VIAIARDQEWYTTEELARIMKVDPSTIRRWRTAYPRQGPPFVRLSFGVVRYYPADVQEWLSSRRIDPGGTEE
jgi:predicted DNA-binding transcriptional regulator AlpA